MSKYYFQAGNTPALSRAELQAVTGQEILEILPGFLMVELAEKDFSAVFSRLGGTVKAFTQQAVLSPNKAEDLEEYLTKALVEEAGEGKITFSITRFGDTQQSQVSLSAIKNNLKAQGRSARFIEAPRSGLSASVLLHQQVIEFVVVFKEDEILLLKTEAVQDIDHWSEKDRGKPYADRKKGMLPPKVARVMVNLAMGTDSPEGKRLYDPFCGTGTVLLEALEIGSDVIGTDLDEQAAVGAQTNLAWFAETLEAPGKFEVFQRDVSRVLPQDLKQKVDYIVTEPYLGKPKPQFKKLPAIFDGLERMYLGAFRRWSQFLKPGAKVVIVFPRVETETAVFSLEKFIDKLEKYGYTSQVNLGEWQYHRPQAVVQRDIMLFTFEPNKS